MMVANGVGEQERRDSLSVDLERLHQAMLACHACVDRGFIGTSAAVVATSYRPGERIMLIGQAPGEVELIKREPFSGRAGRILFRWMERIGLDEASFRRRVYMTALTKCFPGKAPNRGGGDRRPSPEEIRLCRPFLEQQMKLIDPGLILLVGKMAIDLYLPARPLEQAVGQIFLVNGREMLPLPHPSGMSRWLNDRKNQALLDEALKLLSVRLAASSIGE